jgi:hypothetical protein
MVIAKIRGSDQTVVRDVTDVDHPSTVATVNVPTWMSGWRPIPSFASPSAISYVAEGRQLIRLSVTGSGSDTTAAVCRSHSIRAFGWSPDGQAFTYLVDPFDPQGAFQWHLVVDGADRVIGTAPIACYCGGGTADMNLVVQFSPDGQFAWLEDSLGWRGTSLQVRRLDGSLVGAEIKGDRSGPTMGVWSGTDLFFRDKQGVERWNKGDIKPFLPGVAWLHPKASPHGGLIVYAVRASDGLGRVYVVNTSNGQTRQLSTQPRTWPYFVNARYVWYRGERLCAPAETMCIGTEFLDSAYIFDLQTGTESESRITDIADVWPHGV